MANTSPGYSITMRVGAPPALGVTADLATAVITAGGSLTALDVVESNPDTIVDITCDAINANHADLNPPGVSGVFLKRSALPAAGLCGERRTPPWVWPAGCHRSTRGSYCRYRQRSLQS